MHPVLSQAIKAAKEEDYESARRLLAQILEQDPDDERAWLWMSQVVSTAGERAFCLRQALRINPGNPLALQGLAALEAQRLASGPLEVTPEPVPPAPEGTAEPKPDWKPAIVHRPRTEETPGHVPQAVPAPGGPPVQARPAVPLPLAVANGIVIATLVAGLVLFREQSMAALSTILSVTLMVPIIEPQPAPVPGFDSGQAVLAQLEDSGHGYYRLALPPDAVIPPIEAMPVRGEPIAWVAEGRTRSGGVLTYFDPTLEAIVPLLLIDAQGLPVRGIVARYESSSDTSVVLVDSAHGAFVPRLVVIDHPTLLAGTSGASRPVGLALPSRLAGPGAPVTDAVVLVVAPVPHGTARPDLEQAGLELLDFASLAQTASGWQFECLTAGQLVSRTASPAGMVVLSVPDPAGTQSPDLIALQAGQTLGRTPDRGSILEDPDATLLLQRYLFWLPMERVVARWATQLIGLETDTVELALVAGACVRVPDLRGMSVGDAREMLGTLGLKWVEYTDDGLLIPLTATQVLGYPVVGQLPEPALGAMLPVGGADGFEELRIVVQLSGSDRKDTEGPCRIVAQESTPVRARPGAAATLSGALEPGEQVLALARTPNARWYGFDPGVAGAGTAGVFRLRWVQAGKTVQLEGDCGNLDQASGPLPNVCYTVSLGGQPVHAEPVATSQVLRILAEGEYAEVEALTEDGWARVDLSRGSPPMDLQGWVQGLNLDGPCDGLSFVPHP